MNVIARVSFERMNKISQRHVKEECNFVVKLGLRKPKRFYITIMLPQKVLLLISNGMCRFSDSSKTVR